MKAADIEDSVIYDLVRQAKSELGQDRWTIFAALPQFPAKVVDAKLTQMVNKGRLEGCAPCGCRGDFRIPKGGKP